MYVCRARMYAWGFVKETVEEGRYGENGIVPLIYLCIRSICGTTQYTKTPIQPIIGAIVAYPSVGHANKSLTEVELAS